MSRCKRNTSYTLQPVKYKEKNVLNDYLLDKLASNHQSLQVPRPRRLVGCCRERWRDSTVSCKRWAETECRGWFRCKWPIPRALFCLLVVKDDGYATNCFIRNLSIPSQNSRKFKAHLETFLTDIYNNNNVKASIDSLSGGHYWWSLLLLDLDQSISSRSLVYGSRSF